MSGIRKASGVIAYHQLPTADGRSLDFFGTEWSTPLPIMKTIDGFPECIGMIEAVGLKLDKTLKGGKLIIGDGWVGGTHRWQCLRVALYVADISKGTPRADHLTVLNRHERSAWTQGTGLRTQGKL